MVRIINTVPERSIITSQDRRYQEIVRTRRLMRRKWLSWHQDGVNHIRRIRRIRRKGKMSQFPDFPKGWCLDDYDSHEYVEYVCNCSFYKVSKGEHSRVRWNHCDNHKKKLDIAVSEMDRFWNNLLKEEVKIRLKR